MFFSDMDDSLDRGGSAAAVGSILTSVDGLGVIRHDVNTPRAITAGSAVFLGDTLLNDGTDDVWIGLNDGSAILLAPSHRLRIDSAICDANGCLTSEAIEIPR